MVVLHEVGVDPGGCEKVAAAIALEKKAARIAKDPGLKDEHAWQSRGSYGVGHGKGDSQK
jgi:hypothetical protein